LEISHKSVSWKPLVFPCLFSSYFSDYYIFCNCYKIYMLWGASLQKCYFKTLLLSSIYLTTSVYCFLQTFSGLGIVHYYSSHFFQDLGIFRNLYTNIILSLFMWKTCQWIVPNIFKLLPKRHIFFDLVQWRIQDLTLGGGQYNPNLLD